MLLMDISAASTIVSLVFLAHFSLLRLWFANIFGVCFNLCTFVTIFLKVLFILYHFQLAFEFFKITFFTYIASVYCDIVERVSYSQTV